MNYNSTLHILGPYFPILYIDIVRHSGILLKISSFQSSHEIMFRKKTENHCSFSTNNGGLLLLRFGVAGKAATTWLVYNNPRTSNNVVDDVTLEVCAKNYDRRAYIRLKP